MVLTSCLEEKEKKTFRFQCHIWDFANFKGFWDSFMLAFYDVLVELSEDQPKDLDECFYKIYRAHVFNKFMTGVNLLNRKELYYFKLLGGDQAGSSNLSLYQTSRCYEIKCIAIILKPWNLWCSCWAIWRSTKGFGWMFL